MEPKVLLPVFIGTALAFVVAPAVAIAASQSRRRRCVTCPESGRDELVRLGMGRAVAAFFTGGNQRVIDCTRWPDRAGCDRACETDLV